MEAKTLKAKLFGFALCLVASAGFAVAGYADRAEVDEFVALLVDKHGFDASTVRQVLANAEHQSTIIDLISKPAEKKPWSYYRGIFVTPQRISGGVAFIQANSAALERAEQEFGVPKEFVTAIIGVETNYGANKGSFRVIDALTTLGFDYPPRADFFRGQLVEFFVLACEERLAPFEDAAACQRDTIGSSIDDNTTIEDLVGSYAGAMGFGQFIPSSYRNFAIDYDNDGRRDIWHNVTDAIGSVAAYFVDHGWQRGQPVVVAASINGDNDALDEVANGTYKPTNSIGEWRNRGVLVADVDDTLMASLYRFETDEQTSYYLGLQNFYVITRYNISHLYAMAVSEVANGIAAEL